MLQLHWRARPGLVSVLRKQEDLKFEASLDYIARTFFFFLRRNQTKPKNKVQRSRRGSTGEGFTAGLGGQRGTGVETARAE